MVMKDFDNNPAVFRAFLINRLLVLFIFLFPAILQPAAAALSPTLESRSHRIRDGHQDRSFTVALDEVAVTTPSGVTIERIPEKNSPENIRQLAKGRKASGGPATRLVLYESGMPRNKYSRRILTGKLLLRLSPGADASKLATSAGMINAGEISYAPGCFIFTTGEPAAEITACEFLRIQPDVLSADPLLAREREKKLIPNDPLFTNQWHLLNYGQQGGASGIDVNITNVWNTFRGSNIVIGILDDGLQSSHPDLSINLNTNISHNWNAGASNDANPILTKDVHGTACAGLAGARGNNGIGCSGTAPEATLVGLRLIADPADDQDEAEAFAYSNSVIYVKNNSWCISDTGYYVDGPGLLASNALYQGVTSGRGGKGTIYVFAAGNGLQNGDNANYDGYANSPYTIAVGAITDQGKQPYYGEPGACIVISAPSGAGIYDVVTTDLTGNYGYNTNNEAGELADRDYTRTFDGTSAAAPVVSGIVALMLEANPDLGWRDVQEILIVTARLIDQSDGDWAYNGADLHFNHKYGAGLIDADAAVTMAQTWTNLGTRVSSPILTNTNLAIPDNDISGVSCEFLMTNENIRVEHAILSADITHPFRGDIAITLTSPNGTQSRLAEQHGADSNANFTAWPFMTVRNWGEHSKGKWKLNISDRSSGDTGFVSRVSLQLFGTDKGSNMPPVLFHIGDITVPVGNTSLFTVVANDMVDGDAITLSSSNMPPWAGFPSTTSNSTVSSVFSCFPTATGAFQVAFAATDKDGCDSETLNLTVRVEPVQPLCETFNLSSCPAGWSVKTNGDGSAYWRFDSPGSRFNMTGGTGNLAIADSDHAAGVNMDTELRTPVLNLTNLISATLRFKSDFRKYSGSETANVDISTNGASGPWSTIWNEDGTFRGPITRTIDISSLAAGKSNVVIRFHYFNANFDWWWQIDDVVMSGATTNDVDNDGLPNWWEQLYFSGTTNANPAVDSDYDGVSNSNEFLAGTSPTNIVSVFKFAAISNVQSMGADIRWNSVYGKRYKIDRSTNLTSGFSCIASNINATPGTNFFTDSSSTNYHAVFYRVRTQ